MNYEEFASDLPTQDTFKFRSEEECEEALAAMGIEQPLRQVSGGNFQYRLAMRSTPEGEFFADRFSVAVSMHLEPPPGMIGILFPRTASGRFLASGIQTGDRKLIVVPHGSGADVVGPDLVGSEAIMIPRQRFSELIEVLCRTRKPIRPESVVAIPGDTPKLHALRTAVLAEMQSSDRAIDHEALANLIAATLEWAGRYSCGWKSERLCGCAVPTRIAKVARDFIEENYGDSIHVEELCRTTGAAARTLQRCFRGYFDLTVTDYIKTVRLDAARRELLASHRSETTVTDVALRHGNAHIGRFSVGYRQRFGESPKQTLAA